MGDTTLGLLQFDRAANGTFMFINAYRGPSNETFRAVTGHTSAAGVFSVLALQSTNNALWHFNPLTAVLTRLALAGDGALWKGLSQAPYSAAVRQPSVTNAASGTPSSSVTPSGTPSAPGTPPPTPTNTPTASVTASSTGTPTTTATLSQGASPSPTWTPSVTATASPFPGLSRGSLLVLSVCGTDLGSPFPATNAANNTCPIVIEEWDIDNPFAPSLLQSIALPTVQNGANYPCTMVSGRAGYGSREGTACMCGVS
jgi:hypothetical protein